MRYAGRCCDAAGRRRHSFGVQRHLRQQLIHRPLHLRQHTQGRGRRRRRSCILLAFRCRWLRALAVGCLGYRQAELGLHRPDLRHQALVSALRILRSQTLSHRLVVQLIHLPLQQLQLVRADAQPRTRSLTPSSDTVHCPSALPLDAARGVGQLLVVVVSVDVVQLVSAVVAVLSAGLRALRLHSWTEMGAPLALQSVGCVDG